MGVSEPARTAEIHVEGVSMAFGHKGREAAALRDVSFEIYPGELVSILGRRGAARPRCCG